MRKTIIAGNWKMYKNISQAIELATGIKRGLYALGDCNLETVLCPGFCALSEVSEVIAETDIALGAQDVFWQAEGAFTGEISCAMIKDAGCRYCIIGHSERRQFFFETNETVNKKVKSALLAGLTPIMCVGETLAQREQSLTFKVLEDHVFNGLTGLSDAQAQNVVIAYEPVWAIGTGKTATPAQAQEAHHFIRSLLEKIFGKEASQLMRIQYGGSVKPENTAELISQPDIDGALVGGASLNAESFIQIIKKASEIKK